MNFDSLASRALRLPEDERLALAELLWMSAHTEESLNAAWDDEIQRRIAQIDTGEAECLSWETVVAEQRERLRRTSQTPR